MVCHAIKSFLGSTQPSNPREAINASTIIRNCQFLSTIVQAENPQILLHMMPTDPIKQVSSPNNIDQQSSNPLAHRLDTTDNQHISIEKSTSGGTTLPSNCSIAQTLRRQRERLRTFATNPGINAGNRIVNHASTSSSMEARNQYLPTASTQIQQRYPHIISTSNSAGRYTDSISNRSAAQRLRRQRER